MSALALGTAQFGLDYGIANQRGRVSGSEGRAILTYARANGVNTLDTAVAYGGSEQRLGEIGVDGWQIISKLPPVPEACADVGGWVAATLRMSLQHLRVTSLYGLLLHRPQQLREPCGATLYQALRQLTDDGLVEKVGISIYDPPELDLLDGHPRLELVQAPFNLLDRRLIETGWLALLQERQIELHVRSVFLQGLLLMSEADRPRRFDRWSGVWSAFHQWLNHAGLTPLQACLRDALSFPAITKVVVGVDTVAQLDEIIRAASGPAPDVPATLSVGDRDLLNPARWGTV